MKPTNKKSNKSEEGLLTDSVNGNGLNNEFRRAVNKIMDGEEDISAELRDKEDLLNEEHLFEEADYDTLNESDVSGDEIDIEEADWEIIDEENPEEGQEDAVDDEREVIDSVDDDPEEDAGSLFTNKLRFDLPKSNVIFGLSLKEKEGYRRFHFGKLPSLLLSEFPSIKTDNPFVWLNLDAEEDDHLLEVDLSKYPAACWYWFTERIHRLLAGQFRLSQKTYLDDWQYWQEIPDPEFKDLIAFRKFTIKVLTIKDSTSANLLVTYDGLSYVVNKNVNTLSSKHGMDTQLLIRVVFEKQIHFYNDHLKENVRYNTAKIYPVLNRPIAIALGLPYPFYTEKLKLTRAYEYIDAFSKKYLNTREFRVLVPHTGNWQLIDAKQVLVIGNRSRNFSFGEGNIGNNILNGVRDYGPARLIPKRHAKIFMIFRKSDTRKALRLKDYIYGDKGFLALPAFVRLPLTYFKPLTLELEEESDMVEAAEKFYSSVGLEDDTAYFAFYISPFSKWEEVPANREVYYRIKELLLKRGIMSQAIDSNKFTEFSIKMSMGNIGLAMIAKLGGIPWQLEDKTQQELVIGFGAYKSMKSKQPFVGSAFCFDDSGQFQEFDCWPAKELWALHGILAEAIKKYKEKNKEIKRLVIHYYKPLRKKDFADIDRFLDDLDEPIPVIVVRMNNSFENEVLVFNPNQQQKLPENGT
ncbi:hypothetical protein L6260_04060 [Candidatus Parcubacteria bacterium]|nr:hypothetical protein [Candidatus Parcubacteria bacterium]